MRYVFAEARGDRCKDREKLTENDCADYELPDVIAVATEVEHKLGRPRGGMAWAASVHVKTDV